ncbi:MAG: twin-arginine translocation signal domain-containing protein [Deinococcota bacterium]
MTDTATQPSHVSSSSKKLSRRTFLKRAGATTVVAVSGGAVYRAASQGVFTTASGPAYEPWEDWRTNPEQGPLRLVQAGILASNPHNTQPWYFEVSEDNISVFADMSRHLGTMDPYCREMYTGLGCAIENMVLAGQVAGYNVSVNMEDAVLDEPAGESLRQVATLTLEPGEAQTSALYDAIPNRHTDRAPYADTPVAAEVFASLIDLVDDSNTQLFFYTPNQPEFAQLVTATVSATEFIIADADMSRDSHAWFKRNWQEVQQDKDGVFIDASGSSALLRAFVKMMPPMPVSTMDNGWLSGTQASLASTPVLGFIAVRDLYGAAQSLQAGRIWQRMHLWATTQGLSMQPINQLPEQVDRERQLGQPATTAAFLSELTGDETWRPTFVFRLGHTNTNVLPSARRPVEDVLI